MSYFDLAVSLARAASPGEAPPCPECARLSSRVAHLEALLTVEPPLTEDVSGVVSDDANRLRAENEWLRAFLKEDR